jgi:hypothetical protein
VTRIGALALLVAIVLLFAPIGLPLWARVAAILAMPYWLGPFAIYFTQKQPRVAHIDPIEPGGAPPPVAARFDETVRALAPAGFTEGARLRQAPAPNFIGFAQLLEQVAEGAVCTRLIMLRRDTGQVAADALYFVTREHAERRLMTTSSAIISPSPPNPTVDAARLPSVRDPARLWAIHAARAAEVAVVKDGLPQLGSPGDYQQAREREGKEHLARSGWWRLDATADVYRPTPIGAVLLTMRALFPGRAILRARFREEERRLLARYRG